jgi:hypothetical protein
LRIGRGQRNRHVTPNVVARHSLMELMPADPRPRSPAAERMRLARQRRRDGLRCYTIELHDGDLNGLQRRGFLAAEHRADRNAVLIALYSFLDVALRGEA